MQRLVVATRNPGKVREFARLLDGLSWEVVGLDDVGFTGELDEPADDYAGNATAKAEAVCDATGYATLADDSGIEVVALDGWPGPHSARWMGEDASDGDRLAGLIAEVDRRSPDDRRVRYVAAIAVARPEAGTIVALGAVDGTLVEPDGNGGFGYDPAFMCTALGLTFGTADPVAKDAVSHRGNAVRRLIEAHVL